MLESTISFVLFVDTLNEYTNQTEKDDIKMRKFMTKEVTVTNVKVANIGIDENGLPKVDGIETIVLLGDLTKEKAEKKLRKANVTKTIFNVEMETKTYKMEVSEFIKVATLVTDNDNVDEEETEEE